MKWRACRSRSRISGVRAGAADWSGVVLAFTWLIYNATPCALHLLPSPQLAFVSLGKVTSLHPSTVRWELCCAIYTHTFACMRPRIDVKCSVHALSLLSGVVYLQFGIFGLAGERGHIHAYAIINTS